MTSVTSETSGLAPPDWMHLRDRMRDVIARRISSSDDVDDVLQDALMRVHRGLPALKDDDRLAPFVVRVARSAVIDFYRRRAARTHLVAKLQGGSAGGAGGGFELGLEDDPSDAIDLSGSVRPFVERLDEPYRSALRMTELEGRTQAEAAALAGVPLSTMKSRVQRGRAQLRRAFEECCEIALDRRGRVVECTPRIQPRSTSACECDD